MVVGMMNRKILCSMVLLSILFNQAVPIPISLFLNDEVSTDNKIIIHTLKAYNDLENVTVVDYFSDVRVENLNLLEENFLGKNYKAIRIPVGNMRENESKIITYALISANGTALLGADTYLLEGEEHRLSPKSVEIQICEETIYQRFAPFVSPLALLVILVSIVVGVILGLKNKKRHRK